MFLYLFFLARRYRGCFIGFVVATVATQLIAQSGHAKNGNTMPTFWIMLACGVQYQAITEGLFGKPVVLNDNNGASIAYFLKTASLFIVSAPAWSAVTMYLFPQWLFADPSGWGLYAGLAPFIIGYAIILSLFGTWPLASLQKQGRSLSAAALRGRRSFWTVFARLLSLLFITQPAYFGMIEFQSGLPPHTISATIDLPNVFAILILMLAGFMQAAAIGYMALVLAKTYAESLPQEALSDASSPAPGPETPAA